jgi:hypothetical protein
MSFITQSFLHLRDLILHDEGPNSFLVGVGCCGASREAWYQHPCRQKCEGYSSPLDLAREKHDFSLVPGPDEVPFYPNATGCQLQP